MENIVALKTKVQVKQATSLVACTWPTLMYLFIESDKKLNLIRVAAPY